jgi:hypothetical protein
MERSLVQGRLDGQPIRLFSLLLLFFFLSMVGRSWGGRGLGTPVSGSREKKSVELENHHGRVGRGGKFTSQSGFSRS